MTKVVKEIIIMLLVCLVTMLVLAIALYKFIPNRKAVPEVVTYTASEDVQDLLEDNIDQKDDSDNVILTYEVTSSDLSSYQSAKTYVPGKSNPFAPSSSTVDGEYVEGNTSGTSGNTQTNPNKSNESTSPSVYQNNKSTK